MANLAGLKRQLLLSSRTNLLGKAVKALRQGGLRELVGKGRTFLALARHRPVPGAPQLDRRDYAEWIRRYDTFTDERRVALTERLARMPERPRISVVMPTYNPRREWLVEAIESVRAQVYAEWELCIADDASPQPHVREVLMHYAQLDSRIRITLREANGHISATSNSALALATGEWIALLDHDDLLPPDALAEVALAIDRYPQARLIYSDEDKLGPAGRFGPYFKSDWNPDLFLSQNMFSHLGVLHAGLVREVGGFRIGLEGSQDYDLVLRCLEKLDAAQVVHIPRVLYHWRVHEESTAGSQDAKPYAQLAAVRALQEHAQRLGRSVEVTRAAAGYRVVPALPLPQPKCAIVVPDAGALPRRTLHRLVAQLTQGLGGYPTRIVLQGIEHFDVPDVLCFAGSLAELSAELEVQSVELVCLIREPVVPRHVDWLTELVRHARQQEVGVAAPMLLSPSGLIASAGVVLCADGSGQVRGRDAHAGFPAGYAGHGGRAQLIQNWWAVRDLCVVMRLSIFKKAAEAGVLRSYDGGLALGKFIREQGLRVLWTPFSRLSVSRESMARTPLGSMPAIGACDPFYNPNLHGAEADFTLAWPARGGSS